MRETEHPLREHLRPPLVFKTAFSIAPCGVPWVESIRTIGNKKGPAGFTPWSLILSAGVEKISSELDIFTAEKSTFSLKLVFSTFEV